jgi:hypothetical protein
LRLLIMLAVEEGDGCVWNPPQLVDHDRCKDGFPFVAVSRT